MVQDGGALSAEKQPSANKRDQSMHEDEGAAAEGENLE